MPSLQELLNHLKNVGQQKNKGTLQADEVIAVNQHDVAYTNSDSVRPILASSGAGPCVIMAVYNPKTKTAALTHIDIGTKMSSVREIFDELRSDGNDPLEIHLGGGNRSKASKRMLTRLIKEVDKQANVEIKSANLLDENIEANDLAIDTRTGEIFTNFDILTLDERLLNESRMFEIIMMEKINNTSSGRGPYFALRKTIDGRDMQSQNEYESQITNIIEAARNSWVGKLFNAVIGERSR